MPYFGYIKGSIPSEAIMIISLLAGFLAVIAFVLLADHILTGVALMKISKRREVKYGWLAFLPVLDNYVTGALAGSFDEERGLTRKWSALLITTNILGPGLFLVSFTGLMTTIIMAIISSDGNGELSVVAMAFLILFYILYFVSILAISVWSVFFLVCHYKIFEALAPEKSLKYMILSILVPFAGAILLLKCEKTMADRFLSVEEL